jgi:hypothetical protein
MALRFACHRTCLSALLRAMSPMLHRYITAVDSGRHFAPARHQGP